MSSITHIFITALEALFAFGIVGSALVVILTSIEDLREVFTDSSEASSDRQREVENRASAKLADHTNFASM